MFFRRRSIERGTSIIEYLLITSVFFTVIMSGSALFQNQIEPTQSAILVAFGGGTETVTSRGAGRCRCSVDVVPEQGNQECTFSRAQAGLCTPPSCGPTSPPVCIRPDGTINPPAPTQDPDPSPTPTSAGGASAGKA